MLQLNVMKNSLLNLLPGRRSHILYPEQLIGATGATGATGASGATGAIGATGAPGASGSAEARKHEDWITYGPSVHTARDIKRHRQSDKKMDFRSFSSEYT